MLNILADNFISLLCNLPLNKGQEIMKTSMAQMELKGKVVEQIERYMNREYLSLSQIDDCDFNRLNVYIKEHLYDRLCACFNLPEIWQRESAKTLLIDSAYTEAGAISKSQKKIVYSYIQMLLEIIEKYYIEEIDDRLWFLAGKTIEEQKKIMENVIQKSNGKIMEAINYHNSFAEFIDGIVSPQDNYNSFHYRNKLIRFQGRTDELKILEQFLQDPRSILWMAVVGKGGVGKSKLLYNFVYELQTSVEWKTVWLYREIGKRSVEFKEWRYPRNLLFVVDYVGGVAEEIGIWMRLLESCKYRPAKIRFVLLEREINNLATKEQKKYTTYDMENQEISMPLWYKKFRGVGEQSRCVDRLHYLCRNNSPFLKLSGLDKVSIEKIICDYASSKGKSLDAEKRKWILKKADNIEYKNINIRPLIAIFITDSVLFEKEYDDWIVSRLVNSITNRYRTYWKDSLCDGKKELFDALEEMIMFSTVTGGWSIDNDDLPEIFLESADIILSLDVDELESIISAVNETNDNGDILRPLEPDLIGEFYVLNYWNKKRKKRNYLHKIGEVFWRYPYQFFSFLERCIKTYYNEPDFITLFTNEMLFRLEPFQGGIVQYRLYARLLILSVLKDRENNIHTLDQEIIKRLANIRNLFSEDEEIAFYYSAELMLNTVYKDKIEISLVQVEKVLNQFPESQRIFENYIIICNHYCPNVDIEKSEKYIEKISTGSLNFLDAVSVATCCAVTIYNFFNQLNKKNVSFLEKKSILKNISKNQALAEMLASLVIKNYNIENVENNECLSLLKKLFDYFHYNEHIALSYASVLYNLCRRQKNLKRIQDILIELGRIVKYLPHNQELNLRVSSLLAEYTADTNWEITCYCVSELSKMYKYFCGNIEFVLCYATGLYNLLIRQDLDNMKKTALRIQFLANQFPQNEKIAWLLARGLVWISSKLEKNSSRQAIKQLEMISNYFPQNKNIILEYIKGIYNNALIQDSIEIQKNLYKFEIYTPFPPEDLEIALLYSMTLYTLICKQNTHNAQNTLTKLKMLHLIFFDNKMIEQLYINALSKSIINEK